MAYPSFSVGEVLTANDMNAVGLWLVKSQQFTTLQTWNVTDCFNANFSNYRIIVNFNTFSAGGSLVVETTFGSATTNGYYNQVTRQSNGTTTTYANQANTGFFSPLAADNDIPAALAMDVYNPQKSTTQTFWTTQAFAFNSIEYTQYVGGGYYSANTAFTSINFKTPSGTMSGYVRVYGYRD